MSLSSSSSYCTLSHPYISVSCHQMRFNLNVEIVLGELKINKLDKLDRTCVYNIKRRVKNDENLLIQS